MLVGCIFQLVENDKFKIFVRFVSIELFSIKDQIRSEPKLINLKQRLNRNHFAIRKINRNK